MCEVLLQKTIFFIFDFIVAVKVPLQKSVESHLQKVHIQFTLQSILLIIKLLYYPK